MISLVIPLYNEQDNVRALKAKLDAFFVDFRQPCEVILVNDGSTDSTLTLLKQICEVGYKIVTYPCNRGKGYALRRGMRLAEGEYVFYTDADLTYGLDVISRALKMFEKWKCDMVIGTRRPVSAEDQPDAAPEQAGMFSHALGALIRGYLRIAATDSLCGFKGFRTEMAKHLFSKCRVDGFGIDFEVLYLAAAEHVDVRELSASPVNYGRPSRKPVRDTLQIIHEMREVKRLHRRHK